MGIIMQLLSVLVVLLLINALVPSIVRSVVKKMPPKKGRKVKSLSGSKRRGWYGVEPTVWDWFVLVLFMSFTIIGCLLTIFLFFYLKQKTLDHFLLQQGDLMVLSYLPVINMLPLIFLGLVWGIGVGSLVSELLFKILTVVTGKHKKQIAPALFNQSIERMGIDGGKLNVLFYGKIGGLLLVMSIIGLVGGYTRFTNSGITHRDWPGLVEKRYEYSHIVKILVIESYKNSLTHKIEDSTRYGVVMFDDGWQWKTTYINQGFVNNYTGNGTLITDIYVLEYLADKAGVELSEGIKNIDIF
jgi:hypothetical protein